MAQSVKIWFDLEADFLEVLFSDAPGFMRATQNDAIIQMRQLLEAMLTNPRSPFFCVTFTHQLF